MRILDNKTLKISDALANSIDSGSKLSIAAASFSMYAYNELKEQLAEISEMRFLFTSPAFLDNISKQKRRKAKEQDSIDTTAAEGALEGTAFENRIKNAMMR